jgi:hypothetical protein
VNFFRRSRPTVSEKVQGCTRLFMEFLGYHSNINPPQFSTMNRRQQKSGARREALFVHWIRFNSSPIRVCSTGTSGGAGTSTSIWNLATVFLSEKWLSVTSLSSFMINCCLLCCQEIDSWRFWEPICILSNVRDQRLYDCAIFAQQDDSAISSFCPRCRVVNRLHSCPPFSLDLAPSDFCRFCSIKNKLQKANSWGRTISLRKSESF